MGTQQADELRDFHHFLGEQLSRGGVSLSPEEALDQWRQLHESPQNQEEEIAAIQEALDDMANGDRGVSLTEFDQAFRKQHNLPANP